MSGTDVLGAGLGVYHKKNDNSDDNITDHEAIKLHFDKAVSLSSVGLRSDGHNTTQWMPGATFQYSFDNNNWVTAALPERVGQFALTHTGTDFYFRFTDDKKTKGDQFYLSSVSVTAVPEPETFAMLLAGLGFMGFIARRQRKGHSTF